MYANVHLPGLFHVFFCEAFLWKDFSVQVDQCCTNVVAFTRKILEKMWSKKSNRSIVYKFVISTYHLFRKKHMWAMKNTTFPSHYTGYLVNNPVINPVIGHTVIIPVQRAIEIGDPLSIVISFIILHSFLLVTKSAIHFPSTDPCQPSFINDIRFFIRA